MRQAKRGFIYCLEYPGCFKYMIGGRLQNYCFVSNVMNNDLVILTKTWTRTDIQVCGFKSLVSKARHTLANFLSQVFGESYTCAFKKTQKIICSTIMGFLPINCRGPVNAHQPTRSVRTSENKTYLNFLKIQFCRGPTLADFFSAIKTWHSPDKKSASKWWT